MATLQELMDAGKPDPKRMELQARYSNAQFAVDMSYRLADKHVYISEVKVPNPLWKEGDEKYDKFNYIEPTSSERIAKLVELARMLKPEIEKDLNETLKVLEVQDEGAKADASKLS